MSQQTNRNRRLASADSRRAAATARREAQAKAERRRRLTLGLLVGVVVIAAVGGLTAAVLASRHHRSAQLPSAAIAAAATAAAASPPWARPADTTQRAASAGLTVSSNEGTVVHYHVHLDVIDDGQHLPVPANLGIGTADLSELHTHDGTGVLHVEAPAKGHFVLGQLFDLWNVRLDSRHLGALTAAVATPLNAYVNGALYGGNPAAIELKAHQEIALVYGKLPDGVHPPSSYSFPAGE